MKFVGLYGTVGFIATLDVSFWGLSDLWNDIWPAIDAVVYLSILLEEETIVSNNFTKRRQNGFKIGTRDTGVRDKFEVGKLYFKSVIYTTFFYDHHTTSLMTTRHMYWALHFKMCKTNFKK